MTKPFCQLLQNVDVREAKKASNNLINLVILMSMNFYIM